MPIMEDEHGTYIMNSKDLRAVEYVERLTQIGVDSLKIEGRTKSLYYVSRTAQIYRRAIDDAVAGRPFNPELITELEGLSNRGYTGRLSGAPPRPTTTRTTKPAVRKPSAASSSAKSARPKRATAGCRWKSRTASPSATGSNSSTPPATKSSRWQSMQNADGLDIQIANGSPLEGLAAAGGTLPGSAAGAPLTQ